MDSVCAQYEYIVSVCNLQYLSFISKTREFLKDCFVCCVFGMHVE